MLFIVVVVAVVVAVGAVGVVGVLAVVVAVAVGEAVGVGLGLGVGAVAMVLVVAAAPLLLRITHLRRVIAVLVVRCMLLQSGQSSSLIAFQVCLFGVCFCGTPSGWPSECLECETLSLKKYHFPHFSYESKRLTKDACIIYIYIFVVLIVLRP